jgi:hypothetical protein
MTGVETGFGREDSVGLTPVSGLAAGALGLSENFLPSTILTRGRSPTTISAAGGKAHTARSKRP